MLLLAVLRPVEVDVDSELMLLLVADRPVDSELSPVEADVDNEVTALLVVDRPVDSELTPL
ncbi:chromosome segregation ATPase [Burkholderia mayonis]|uniref:Chromosome segregation ATPase n=1 Tax=Burkholderia mayonis TaxID=1385591 RepID=A0A1B4G5G2_9BURK|nr:chromosome segregation ATPase [Burkholderia mayonis]KVE55375.1 chromosome segregation ATPase [Burkholderia mayonis]